MACHRSFVSPFLATSGAGARSLLVLAMLSTGCARYSHVKITESPGLDPDARVALANDGVVVAATPHALLVGAGGPVTTIDLGALGLEITAFAASRPVQVRSEGEIVFVASRASAAGCPGSARGAYRLTTSGGPLGTLLEGCVGSGMPQVGRYIAMSANGKVAVSDIVSGVGAIHRGPVTGPLTVLRTGTGEFFNTMGIDINDVGRVTVQMEYVDGFAGGLMRGVLAFDTPGQAKADLDTAIEKLGVGTQPPHAIDDFGVVALSLPHDVSFPIGSTTYHYAAGIYTANPTQFNTPKALTLVADLSGPYCRFGAVDIANDGTVVFEAQLDDGPDCTDDEWDGIYTGPNPDIDAVVERGEAQLGAHENFDDVRLGEINAGGQVAFVTTVSEPMVPPVVVWRADP